MNKSADFNFQIDQYTKQDLEEIFETPPGYDSFFLISQESKMKLHILQNKEIPPATREQMLQFLSQARMKLDKSQRAVDTNLIRHPGTTPIPSQPSEFYPGILNPLNKRILKQHVNIDTRFRENYYGTTSGNFHLTLPIKFSQVVSMQLTALELPTTFYIISKSLKNNYFTLQLDTESNPNPFVVVIPDGNYDYLALQTCIQTILNTSDIYSDIVFTADYQTPGGSGPGGGSGRMVVQSQTGQSFSLLFLTDELGKEDKVSPLPSKLGWLMGFRSGTYEGNSQYVSEGIINLVGPRYIFLVVDDYNNNVSDGFYGAFHSSMLNKNILARISLQDSVFYSQSFHQNTNMVSTPRQYFGPVDIQKLQIQLLDEYGRVVHLNHMDFSFCLTLQSVYDL
jgi:hypothetical protein